MYGWDLSIYFCFKIILEKRNHSHAIERKVQGFKEITGTYSNYYSPT